MAAGFCVYSVPDEHVADLKNHPGWVFAYITGEAPKGQDRLGLPADWPTEALAPLSDWGINHRNVDLYHWILNGGPELVEGSGSIFQTWYEPDHHSALKLDGYNEAFAFEARQVRGLVDLVEKVDVASVRAAFSGWCKAQGREYDPDEAACTPFVQEFQGFGRGLETVLRQQRGLVWA